MLHGFLAAFVMGFLGTALPRLLDVPRVREREVSLYAFGLSLTTLLHLAGFTFWGDLSFLLTFGGFLGALLNRARQRQDLPPPGFVLVILGLLCGFAGTVLLLIAQPWAYAAGRLLLYQGFLLLPVMGVGAFLLPRFFQLPNRQTFPESLKPPPGWWPRAFFALACGALIFGHCGQSHRFKDRLPAVIAMVVLFVLALTLRLWGEFALTERFTLYGIAGLVWIAGLLAWAIHVLPHVGQPDEE